MPRTFHNLQALRGVACLAVVLYHVAGWETMIWPRVMVLWPVRWFGFAGVDLFFALSGFIITWAHLKDLGRPSQLPTYLFRRTWRIYPPFWAALVTAAVLSYLTAGHPVFAPGWPSDWLYWALLLPRLEGCRLVPVAWSLVYELMFYLVFATLFLTPARAGKWLLGGWALLVLGAKAADWQPGAFWATLPFSPFVLEFLGGAAAAGLLAGGLRIRPRECLLAAAVWVVGFAALLHSRDPDILGGSLWLRVLTFGPPSVLTVYALAAGEGGGSVRLPRWLQPIGDASYSIYLFHAAFGVATMFLTWGISHRLLPHLLWLTLMIGSGVGGGWIMYRLVERPLLRLTRRNPGAHAAADDAPQVSGPHRLPQLLARTDSQPAGCGQTSIPV
jgi:peptidoglycan/LPS O-acetylase OafA/YrhL